MSSRWFVAILLAGLVLPGTLAWAGDSDLKKKVKEDVTSLNDALIDGNYTKVIDMTHSNVVKMLGGREKAISTMKRSMEELKKSGFEINKSTVRDASDIVKLDKEWYLYVPFDLTMKTPQAKLTVQSYVIGVSTDQGKTWGFVDGSYGDSVKKVLPNLPSALKLPEAKKPTIEKN